jgi:predicted acetyltransferase
MDITVTEATLADEPTFRNLFQFYLYEFSRFMGWPVTYAGRFIEIDLDGCWTDEKRQPFLVRADRQLAGFAIVDACDVSELSGSANVRQMSEFFVLAAHRRQGIGDQAATALFDRSPGKWEIRQMAQNADATAFWRAVLTRYTGGHFIERQFDNAHLRGPAQFFDNSSYAPKMTP